MKFLWILLLFSFPALAQQPCTQTEAMNKSFLAQLAAPAGKGTKIAFFPLQDGSQADVDPTLGEAFPFFFHSLLASLGGFAVIHPYLVLNAIEVRGLSNDALFDDDIIAAMAKELGATYAVYGMFQRRPGGHIRTFLKIADLVHGKILGPVIEFETEEGNRFFSVGTDAAKKIIGVTAGKKISPKVPAYDFEAFRYYVKGMDKSRKYQEPDLTISRVWFEKAYSLSYSFTEALAQKARALLMSAFLAQKNGKDVSLEMAELRDVTTKLKGNLPAPEIWLRDSEKALAKASVHCVQ